MGLSQLTVYARQSPITRMREVHVGTGMSLRQIARQEVGHHYSTISQIVRKYQLTDEGS